MDELTNRLSILAESKVITHKTKHKIIDMIYYLNSKYELVLNETNASAFIMHLAMAITRIERGEGFEQVAGAMADEIQREKNFENAKVPYYPTYSEHRASPKKDFLLWVNARTDTVCRRRYQRF